MSGGSYDAYYPSSSYAYIQSGDSWRPSEEEDSYERSAHVPARRRTPSPARHYRPYAPYSSGENNYRPTYRSDEENGYYTRTPSPGPSRRDSDPVAWSPWNRSRNPGWREADRISKSPTTSNRFRNDAMLATRMHPSSSSWRPNLNDPAPRADQPSGYSDDYPTHDPEVYRQTYTTDRHRPEDGYASRSHYRRFSSPDSSSDPYVRSGHSTVPHSPTVGGYRREYTPTSPVGVSQRGYTPTLAATERYAQSREPGRPEYDSYRPGWSPTSPGNSRRREALFSSTGRRVMSGRSPARSPSPGQRRASFTRESRWRGPLRAGSPTSPAHDRLARRRYSRSPDRSVKSSRSNSLQRRLHRSRSPGNRSRSRSPTSSRSNDDSSGTRGRSPRRRSSGTRTSSGKAVWERPASGFVPKKSALNGLRTRSPSRSSIASSRPSERAPSMPVQKPTPPVSNILTGDVIGSTVEHTRKEPNGMDVDDLPLPPKTLAETAIAPGGETLPIGRKVSPEPVSRSTGGNDGQTSLPTPSAHVLETEPPFDLAQMSVDTSHVSKPPPVQPEEPNEAETLHQTSVHDQSSHSGDVPMDVEPEPERKPQPSPPDEEQGDDSPPGVNTSSITSNYAEETIPDIPDRSEAKSRAELLSIVVRTRLLCDRQTRQEIVNPIIISNQIIASEARVDSRHATQPEELVREMTDRYNHGGGPKQVAKIKASLIERFKERETFLKEKTARLRAEYLSLHEKWLAHCATLDEQNRTPVTETEMALPATRSSRRNAVLGDAVRSDLEMEQIIASLGIDDATDPAHLSLRNLAKVPDMISVTKGKVDYYYDDTNHLVQNPADYYGPHTGIHDWTTEEKEIYNAKFAAHPKQFGAIAEYLPNKTASQCVDYYYLHKKKFVDFRKVVARYGPNKRKRKGTGKNKRNALLADIRQHDAEVNRDGVASPTGRTGRGKRTPVPPTDSKDKEGAKETRRTVSTRRRFLQVEDNTPLESETPTPEPELKSRRGRRPATVVINTSLPSTLPTPAPPTPTPAATDGIDRTVSTITEELEDVSTDMERPAKRAKRTRRIKSAAIVEEVDTPEPEAEPSASDIPETSTKGKVPAGAQWSDEDRRLFLGLLGQHGDDFKRISASIPNKTTLQVTNFYNSNLVELDLASIVAKAPKRPPLQADTQPKKTAVSAATSRSASPILRLTPDSVRAQQAATQASSGAQDKSQSNQSEVSKPMPQQKEPTSANGFQRERGSLPVTAQYSYYDHLRHAQPAVYHPGYTQHRSALGPHLPSVVHTMSYMHNPSGMPAYPAHAYHSGYMQYPEVHYPPYNARYMQPSSPPPQVATDANGSRRFAPILPRDTHHSATHAGPPSYHYVGKPNHAP